MRGRGEECCERVHAELVGYGDLGSPIGGENPRCECPGVCGYECGPGVCGVDVCVHERGEMRAATHA